MMEVEGNEEVSVETEVSDVCSASLKSSDEQTVQGDMKVRAEGNEPAMEGEVEKQADVDEKCGSDDDNEETDPYSYTRRQEFTSEIYKIEVNNLPKHYGHGQLKKMFTNQLKLKPNKIKIFNRATYCFVTFRNEEDREFALQAVNGHTWKKCQLRAKKANPSQDPLIRNIQKRKAESSDSETKNKITKKEEEIEMILDDSIPLHVRLNNVVAPLWQKPYEEQLNIKEDDMRDFLRFLAKRLEKQCPNMTSYIRTQKKHHKYQCCKLEPIRPSPVVDAYRNKSEFSIGVSPDGQEKTVGFKMGRYKGGFDTVVEPSQCTIIPESMKDVVKCIQTYIQQSSHPGYNNHIHQGCWKQVTMRTSLNGHVMAIVLINTNDLTEEDIDKEKKSLKSYFDDGDGKEHRPSSLLLQLQKERLGEKSVHEVDGPCEVLFGEPFIYESLLEMKFRISPDAFFQVNTKAAELLYSTIQELSGAGKTTTVLDICCGTGTIGISLAKGVRKVIGIEMNEQAIEDAKYNAQQNGIKNVKYICGKVEDILYKAIYDIFGCTDVVGILDPPRAGLHNKVIRAIRGCQFLNKLLYVSCSPRSAVHNFTDLCRPTSNRIKGEPFKPVCAVPVDLFPHTKHCEMIIVFERERSKKHRRSSSPTLGEVTSSVMPSVEDVNTTGDDDDDNVAMGETETVTVNETEHKVDETNDEDVIEKETKE
ncbi:tRNA (uracil-5-)-methyltransferase homolog A-like isoform X2 [Ptychodera flava]|uniref:tRNA (uracil-5-)-methyltransferase homolog A-like isoform X2 n=1 Tax=Ptychodera flava TaxID=63121 RepID=UPI00396A493D